VRATRTSPRATGSRGFGAWRVRRSEDSKKLSMRFPCDSGAEIMSLQGALYEIALHLLLILGPKIAADLLCTAEAKAVLSALVVGQ